MINEDLLIIFNKIWCPASKNYINDLGNIYFCKTCANILKLTKLDISKMDFYAVFSTRK